MNERGVYIVFEGIDATGKSTQVEKTREWMTEEGEQSVEFHEPGGVPIADELRSIIKNDTFERDPETDLLLFTACRREIYGKKAEPALKLGIHAVAARNWYSSLVYQGHADGIGFPTVERTTRQFLPASYIKPDLAIMLTLADKDERERRIKERGELLNPDRFESREAEFQQRLHRGYEIVAQQYPMHIIDASTDADSVQQKARELIKPLLAKRHQSGK